MLLHISEMPGNIEEMVHFHEANFTEKLIIESWFLIFG